MNAAIYLRKSRADEDKEKYLGQGETLSIHRKELLSLAKIKKINVIQIYEELVSGDSLLHRPAMIDLLKSVEECVYDAVLVMDLQRLGRGDLEEQGMILKAFKKSNTKIITPDKVYDLNNEYDEEYSEFEAFMGRKEYKMINKRLQRGVIHSVNEGNYIGTYAPYGYDIVQDKFSRTLSPNQEQSRIVKMMFNWYAYEKVGGQIIADRLNDMGIKTNRDNKWTAWAVAFIIKNMVYIGKITWRKAYGYYSSNKKKANKTRPKDEWLIVDGKHEPIIETEVFELANKYMKNRIKSPVKPKTTLNNSLAGLVVCGVCGGKMSYRPYPNVEPHLICKNKCGNKSAKFKYIEAAILEELSKIYNDYNIETKPIKKHESDLIETLKSSISSIEKELIELYKQKDNLHDLLERNIYSTDIFIERSKIISEKITTTMSNLNSTNEQLENEIIKQNVQTDIAPKIKKVIDAYTDAATADEKNLLLKTIIDSVIYLKRRNQRENNFKISINTRF